MSLGLTTVQLGDLAARVADLVSIYQRAYASLPSYAYTTVPEVVRYLRWLEKHAGEGFLVAEIAARPVGFIAVDDDWETWHGEVVGEIHEFVVDPDYQGRGIGRHLLEAGLGYLRRRGHEKVGLWVGEKNARARRLYERAGFREEGRWGKWIRMVKAFSGD